MFKAFLFAIICILTYTNIGSWYIMVGFGFGLIMLIIKRTIIWFNPPARFKNSYSLISNNNDELLDILGYCVFGTPFLIVIVACGIVYLVVSVLIWVINLFSRK